MVAEARGHVGEPLAGVDAIGALVHDDDLVEDGQHVVLGGERPQGRDADRGRGSCVQTTTSAPRIRSRGRHGPAGVVEHQLVVVGDDLDPSPPPSRKRSTARRDARPRPGHRARASVRGARWCPTPQHHAAHARVVPDRTSVAASTAASSRGGKRPSRCSCRCRCRRRRGRARRRSAPSAQDLDVELVGTCGREPRTPRPTAGGSPRPPARRRGVSRRGDVGHAAAP